MLTIKRLLTSCVFFSFILPTTATYAEDAQSLAKAITIYKSGFEACVEAHSIRGSNLKAAKEKISFYTQKLAEAKAIDSRIMTTTEQNIDRNIALCNTAEDDILRAEAFPIMQDALEQCNKARTQLNSGDISSADASFKQYNSLKSQAFAITTSLDKQADTKAGMLRCEKTSAKLELFKTEIAAVVAEAEAENKKARQALQSCQSGQALLKATNVNAQTLTSARSQLKQSQTILSSVNFNLQTAASSSQHGVQPIHKTVETSIASTKDCQAALQANIAQNEKFLANKLAAKNAANLEAAKKARAEKLAKQQAAQELATKQEAARLKHEAELAEKQKLNALVLEQENKRKLALEKAEAIKKQQSLKKAQAENNKATVDKGKQDWRELVNTTDLKSTGLGQDEEKASPANEKVNHIKDWTDLIPNK